MMFWYVQLPKFLGATIVIESTYFELWYEQNVHSENEVPYYPTHPIEKLKSQPYYLYLLPKYQLSSFHIWNRINCFMIFNLLCTSTEQSKKMRFDE